SRRFLSGRAAERRRPRRPRLPANGAELLVPSDAHDAVRQARLLADRLHRRRVESLTHFRIAVQDLNVRRIDDADDDASLFRGAVADSRALDTAADARILRVAINGLHGVERFAKSTYAFAHHLTGREPIAGIEDVARADFPSIDADTLGKDAHHAFNGEM